jgi:NTP pyrophosphatase (non-canonical NTP hydrolase)
MDRIRTFEQFEQAAARYDLPCRTTGDIKYYALGLCGEVAEVIEKMNPPSDALSVGLEMGDVMWYVARLKFWIGAEHPSFFMLPIGDLATWHPAPSQADVHRHLIALVVETGRVAEKVKKKFRDGVFDETFVADRLFQVLWRLAHVAGHHGFTLADVADLNVDKLEKRLGRGTISGTGDAR